MHIISIIVMYSLASLTAGFTPLSSCVTSHGPVQVSSRFVPRHSRCRLPISPLGARHFYTQSLDSTQLTPYSIYYIVSVPGPGSTLIPLCNSLRLLPPFDIGNPAYELDIEFGTLHGSLCNFHPRHVLYM